MPTIASIRDKVLVAVRRGGSQPWWLLWLVFLPFGAPMFVALFQSHPSPVRLILTLASAALFLGIYVLTSWQSGLELASPSPLAPRREALLWLPLALMTILAVLLAANDGPVWGGLFIFTIAAAAGRLPLPKALLAIGALILLIVYGVWRAHMAFSDGVGALISAGVTALATLTTTQLLRMGRKLRAEREEMARLAAVTAERLRIARDLHDLLGHSLSLIALKSELAGRLVEAAPARAAAEIHDIEIVARTALQEVREAVAGYRQSTLGDELRAARELLAAAGIRFSLQRDEALEDCLSPATEAALGWAVREGITNVIRHSHARTCRLWLRVDADTAQLDLRDDGAGGPPGDGASNSVHGISGSGLRGLSERVAALGGAVEAAPLSGGGFRLAVSLPLNPRNSPAPDSSGVRDDASGVTIGHRLLAEPAADNGIESAAGAAAKASDRSGERGGS
jgi:two-component system sensor histidine kinase DesK